MNAITGYLSDIQTTITKLHLANVEQAIYLMHEARLNYQRVFIMGNGGSAATASHFVCDLSKGTRVPGCPDFKVIGLNDNMSVFSAYSNDEGYENAFANQLASLVEPGDVVVAFSASGNSPNVLRGIDTANRMNARTIGFTGTDGGRLRDLAQVEVHVNNPKADQVEDVHLMLAHLISRVLKELAKPSILILDPFLDTEDAQTTNEHLLAVNPEVGTQVKGKVSRMIDQSLETLTEIGQNMTDRQDNDGRVLSRVLLKMIINFGAASGSIILLDQKGKAVESILAFGDQAWTSNRHRMLEFLDRGLAGWVVKNRRGVLIQNTNEDPRWIKLTGTDRLRRSYSVLSAPMQIRDRVSGVITLSRPDEDRFTEADLAMLTGMMMTVGYSLNVSDLRV